VVEQEVQVANKMLFKSNRGELAPAADAVNEAGGVAYAMPPKHALAQYAATGCLGHTFYASADEQLATVLDLCRTIEPTFIAKAAIFARSKGYMKDLPALLCAVLTTRAAASHEGRKALLDAFPRVIDDGRMLRNFVQIVRSGVVGRKSLGSLPKFLVREWFARRDDAAVFRASVGNAPSLADVIKMVHPKPATKAREALYGYLIGNPLAPEPGGAGAGYDDLPEIVKQFEAFKSGASRVVPDVPFQMLTGLPLSADDWKGVARNAPWQMTRMNLNTFARHGVFADAGLTAQIAGRLRNPELIAKAKVFPYQLMVAHAQVGSDVPAEVREALQDAMEIAIANVPRLPGGVYVFPDVSGSMHSPVTGYRPGATSAVRCVDVAALVAAAVLRRNAAAEVIPFESRAITGVRLNPRDSVMTNAQKLAALPAGGTNCSAPLAELNRRKAKGDLLIYVSDNESWVDSPLHGRFGGAATATMTEWAAYKARNPDAKLVCIDLQPYGTTQAKERPDVLNVGGFSDRVFDLIGDFARGTLDAGHWVGVIDAIET
jgi:60 kDa SS-A/Ro ribonucleoprotein